MPRRYDNAQDAHRELDLKQVEHFGIDRIEPRILNLLATGPIIYAAYKLQALRQVLDADIWIIPERTRFSSSFEEAVTDYQMSSGEEWNKNTHGVLQLTFTPAGRTNYGLRCKDNKPMLGYELDDKTGRLVWFLNSAITSLQARHITSGEELIKFTSWA